MDCTELQPVLGPSRSYNKRSFGDEWYMLPNLFIVTDGALQLGNVWSNVRIDSK